MAAPTAPLRGEPRQPAQRGRRLRRSPGECAVLRENAPFSGRMRRSLGERTLLPEIGVFSSGTWRLSPPPFHHTLLLTTAQYTWPGRARRTPEQSSSGTQGSEWAVSAWRSLWVVAVVGVDVVLARFLASLPFYYQFYSRVRGEPHHPRYHPSIPDTELVSRGTPPVSPIPGWYPSCSLPRRPGGSRHQPHNILLLFAAQVTEGGGLSSIVSSVSRSGTR